MNPDRAWLSMAKAAGRFGFGPRPNQTIYEYASSLGELVPVAKADLATVADAKVETAYARVRLGGDRMSEVGRCDTSPPVLAAAPRLPAEQPPEAAPLDRRQLR